MGLPLQLRLLSRIVECNSANFRLSPFPLRRGVLLHELLDVHSVFATQRFEPDVSQFDTLHRVRVWISDVFGRPRSAC